eukprot:6503725-Pyramimonas_sp.AAC.1
MYTNAWSMGPCSDCLAWRGWIEGRIWGSHLRLADRPLGGTNGSWARGLKLRLLGCGAESALAMGARDGGRSCAWGRLGF